MTDSQRTRGFGAAARITALAASVMDLHVRMALQEVDREKRRLISGGLFLAIGRTATLLAVLAAEVALVLWLQQQWTLSLVQALLALAAVNLVLAAVYPFTDSFDAVASVRARSGARYFADAFVKPKYRVAGVAFLRESGLEGNLYNNYNMGGFLGYWLAPRLRTFVDGRTEHYPPELLDDYAAVERRRGRLPGEDVGDLLARK